jgi:CDP-4-dehydro-6-deoxyglucose reductase
MNDKLRFAPGQYIEFLLENDKRRSYSIANAPETEGVGQVELHIRHLPGGLFTDRLFTQMKGREMLRFEGPFGTSSLRTDSDKPIIMLASGTGFAPLKSMIEHALAKGMLGRRPITLYWGCRTRADLYMEALPRQWESEHEGFKFVPVLSAPTPDCAWDGRNGLVHHAVIEDSPDLSGYEVYACGAPVMVESARRDLTEHCRLPEDMFIADSFITEAERAA